MSFIIHILASIGLFVAGILGIQSAPPAQQVPVSLSAAATATATQQAAAGGTIDGAFVSFNGKEIVGADPPTFREIADSAGAPTDYSKDKDHVFLGAAMVQGADPKTFVVLSGLIKDTADNVSYYYAKDKSHVFVNDLVIAGADPATFVLVPGNAGFNAKDKSREYKDGSVVQ